MKLTAHWPNDLEMPKVVHNVQFTMTNVQSVLLIGQSVVEFIEVFRSMTNCRICRRIVMEHWPNANEKRCSCGTGILVGGRYLSGDLASAAREVTSPVPLCFSPYVGSQVPYVDTVYHMSITRAGGVL